MSKEKKNTLIMQGSILALAGIITKIIGFIYRIPMANLMGEEGNGLYSVAFGIYNTALTISSYSLPLAVSKLVAYRLAKKEHKNAYRVFLHALVFAIIVGTVAATVLFVGASGLEQMYKKPGLAKPLRILAPTTFVVALLGVFRGYFQGKSNMVPTAISQIAEQFVNAIISVVATYQFTKVYANSVDVSAYGAAGGTLGTLGGALTALFFFMFIFLFYRKSIKIHNRKDVSHVESTGHIYKVLIFTIIPVILSQTIYQIGYTIDDLIYGNIMEMKGVPSTVATSLQGVFNTQYSQLVNLPVAIATAMAASTIPNIVQSYYQDNKCEVHKKIDGVVKLNMVIAIPCAIGLAVLARPIITLLFHSLVTYRGVACNLLIFGSSAVVFYALSTITTAILQGSNYMRVPLIHCGISLSIHIVIVYGLLRFTDLGVYGLIIGNISFPLLVCILNCRAITKYIEYKWNMQQMFIKPLIASAVMGVATLVSYLLVMWITRVMIIGLIVSLLVALIVYLKMLAVLKCFSHEELEEIPLGSKLEKIMNFL
ncbi:MAG: polysaccharide biosynthesis protein [bacterium]|nr:polysaccharide biosynthesis protein [bacterium]